MAEQEVNKTVHEANGSMPKPQQTDGFAVTSLVTGILSIVLCWTIILPFILGILALVFGLISYHKRRSGMALAGAICGGVGILITIIIIIFAVAAANEVTNTYPSYY